MTYNEILSHSLPFLTAINSEINKIRILEAGGNPNGDEENSMEEVESKLPDSTFYGTLNGLMK